MVAFFKKKGATELATILAPMCTWPLVLRRGEPVAREWVFVGAHSF